MNSKRILIIKCDDCDEICYINPFLANLYREFSNLEIIFLTLEKNRNIIEQFFPRNDIDFVFLNKFNPSIISKLLNLGNFDIIFNLDTSLFSNLVSILLKTKKYISYSKFFWKFKSEFVEIYDEEYICDLNNYMLQKNGIQTPVRNMESLSDCLPQIPVGKKYGVYIFSGVENIVVDRFKISIKKYRFDKTTIKYIFHRQSYLNKYEIENIIRKCEFFITDDILIYSYFSKFSRKSILLSSKRIGKKYLIRKVGNYFADINSNSLFDDIDSIIHSNTLPVSKDEALIEPLIFIDFREKKFKSFKNILVLKTGGLGDLILSYPSFSLLRKAYPNAKITALVIPYMLQLVKYNNDIDEVIVYDKQKKKDFRYIYSLGMILKEKKFDAFFLLNRSPRAIALATLARVKNVIGYKMPILDCFISHKVREKNRKKFKVVLQNLDIVRSIGLDVLDISYGDYSIETTKRIGNFINNKISNSEFILINIGGRWPSKKFLPKKWAKLIDALLIKYKYPVLLLWGPDEKNIVNEVYSLVENKKHLHILPSTNMGEVAECISRSKYFITCDTGAMHIADALKKPQIVLMGPTSPVRWGPISENSIIIYHKVKCGPCNIEVCPLGHNKCMDLIKPCEILQKLNTLVNLEEKKDM